MQNPDDPAGKPPFLVRSTRTPPASLILGLLCFVNLAGLEKAVMAIVFGVLALRSRPAPALVQRRAWAKAGVALVGRVMIAGAGVDLLRHRRRRPAANWSKHSRDSVRPSATPALSRRQLELSLSCRRWDAGPSPARLEAVTVRHGCDVMQTPGSFRRETSRDAGWRACGTLIQPINMAEWDHANDRRHPRQGSTAV